MKKKESETKSVTIRKVNSKIYKSFKEACEALHLKIMPEAADIIEQGCQKIITKAKEKKEV